MTKMNAQTLNNVIKAKIEQNTLKFAERQDAQAFQEDAGIDETQMIETLATIFKARQELEYVDFLEFEEYAGMSIEDAQYEFIMECVDEDTTLETLIEDSSTLSWDCWEDWASYYEYINVNVTPMDKDVYEKAVNFLYDGYALEKVA
jgi:hypothetical protein